MPVSKEPRDIACHICGKQGVRLIHPDELKFRKFSEEGLILCNYCHRPVCLDHLSQLKIPKLHRIRPQHFCAVCAESLTGQDKPKGRRP